MATGVREEDNETDFSLLVVLYRLRFFFSMGEAEVAIIGLPLPFRQGATGRGACCHPKSTAPTSKSTFVDASQAAGPILHNPRRTRIADSGSRICPRSLRMSAHAAPSRRAPFGRSGHRTAAPCLGPCCSWAPSSAGRSGSP